MLHIVQVVLAGGAEIPRVFFDETAAQAAFVACAKRYWAQSYAAYCERDGVNGDFFSSAQAFVATLDLADRSRIHYWNVTPEDAGAGSASGLLPGAAALKERREHLLRVAREVEEASLTVRDGLTELLDAIAGLSGDAADTGVQPMKPGADQDAPGRLATTELSSPAPEAPQPSAERYNTREWKEYVESIKSMCGGNRSEFHLFNRYDWRQAVYGSETAFEYWEWVAVQIDEHIEKAQRAGYSVVDDPDKPGHYRFRTPEGVVSDISNEAEGEAWCRAGLHLEGRLGDR